MCDKYFFDFIICLFADDTGLCTPTGKDGEVVCFLSAPKNPVCVVLNWNRSQSLTNGVTAQKPTWSKPNWQNWIQTYPTAHSEETAIQLISIMQKLVKTNHINMCTKPGCFSSLFYLKPTTNSCLPGAALGGSQACLLSGVTVHLKNDHGMLLLQSFKVTLLS